MSDTAPISTVRGDGTRGAIGQLQAFKQIIREIRTECADSIRSRRKELEDVVYCRWPGQRTDGRKKMETLGSDAKPFEGASDNRVRLADRLIREHVRDYMAAVSKAKKRFTPMEGMDAYAAAKLDILVKWLVDTYWGKSLKGTLRLLGRYLEQDTPAVACAMVDWVEERRLEYRMLEPLDLVDLYLELQDQSGAERNQDADQTISAQIIDMCRMPAMRPDLETFLETVIGIKPARAKTAAAELQKTGRTEIPVPYLFKRGPECVALRLFEDVFVPANTTDPQRSRIVYRREWLTEPEVRERAARLKWNPEFVKDLLGDRDEEPSGSQYRMHGHEGKSGFEDYNEDRRVNTNTAEMNLRRGLWEIITAWHYATNDDGVMGIYTTTFSFFVDIAAVENEPFKRKHGRLPFIFQKREELNDRLIDARGIPEMVSTDQNTFKLLRDSFEDHTQVATLPPVKIPPNKPHYRIDLAPLGLVESNGREPTEFMQPPAYPAAADKYWDKVRRDVNEDWGRPGELMDPDIVLTAKQDRVDVFLEMVAEIVKIAVQLCQEYMPDDMFARIVGGSGMEVNRSISEIQGQFDMAMTVDVRDLSLEGIMQKTEVVLKNLRPLDVRSLLPYEQIIRSAVASIDPSWVDAMPTNEQADQREAEEEKSAFVSMLNGVRPPMPESGLNAPLRLRVLQEQMAPRQGNPNAFPPMSAASAELIKERMDYLEFQSAQMQNAMTGRVGVDTSKTDEEIAGMGMSGNGQNGPNGGTQGGMMP